MNCKDANEIDLVNLLAKLGHTPIKQKGNDAWYCSPFRNEKTPSFKVNIAINKYYDFGEGGGGGTVDFVVRYKGCSIKNALGYLSELDNQPSFSFQPQNVLPQSTGDKLLIKKVGKLEHPALLEYIKSRAIDVKIAQKYCEEIHYSRGNSKVYFGVAFRNNSNGFECRNSIFKGALINKDITTISCNSDKVCLFESFTDFLSYKTLNQAQDDEDYLVLNSTSLVHKSVGIIQDYSVVQIYADNDNAGKKATEFIKNHCSKSFKDCSVLYVDSKDLNEHLIKKCEVDRKIRVRRR